MRGEKFFKRTDLLNTGLISADRSNKATLLLTIPSSLFKSSAKDQSSPISFRTMENMLRAALPPPPLLLLYDSGRKRLYVFF